MKFWRTRWCNTTSNEAGATYAGNAGDSSQFEIGAASGVVVLKEIQILKRSSLYL